MNYQTIRFLSCLFFIELFCFAWPVQAQKTGVYRDPEAHFKSGMELFQKEKFSAARREFERIQEDIAGVSTVTAELAAYYQAVCAAELFHPDAEALLTAFINRHPESTRLRPAYFQLGRLFYKQKRYKNATDAFEKADVYYLTNEEITEYYFKAGYAYFIKGEMVKAEKSLHNVIGVDSKYKAAANYYYAHIAYANDNYQTALSSFNKLNESEAFGPVVPLYIAQIYFDQEKYDELLAYAIPLVDKPKLQQAAELKRLIAEAYFRKSDFRKSYEYFLQYQKSVPALSREEYYQLAYCEYQVQRYEDAVRDFQKVSEGNDALAQNACFHLAACYLKLNNKQGARSSFQLAARSQADAKISEDALFSYAKLSYELSFQPVAIKAFREFQERFPESSRKDEASQFLADIFMTTHNYKDALAVLESIDRKTGSANQAYQKVAYYRGLEFYNDGDRKRAIGLFDKAIISKANAGITSMAMYWKAEALYANQQYEPAMKEYRIFLFSPGAAALPCFNSAHYNIGYCFFKMENYAEAQIWFRKYLKNKPETDTERYNDATIRIADANFMLKEYAIALDFYQDAVSNKAKGSDYCLFQKGMIYGINGNMNDKTAAMQGVIGGFRNSSYLDDAIYEKGNALLASGKNNEALPYFQRIVSEFPNSSYTRKALIRIGLIYYNDKNDERALSAYKQVITKYPSTPEASEALNGIKNIYVNSGNPSAYFDFVKTVPSASISTGAQDSITYEAAEQRYMKGDKDAARDFDNYLKQFPEGCFSVNATFYKAESDYRNQLLAEALAGYEFVISRTRNIFTEKSLLKASLINYRNKAYEKALEQYTRLEEVAEFPENILAARAGALRCSNKLNNCEQAVLTAKKIIAMEKAPGDLVNEAHLVSGKCAMLSSDYTVAQKELSQAARVPNSETGAEARYRLAQLQHLLTNYKESLKLAFEVINQVPSYDFWIAKSFILLADNYVAMKDDFQAKSTLKSLLDNYEKNPDDAEDIKVIAAEKLSAIQLREQEQLNKELRENQHAVPVQQDSIESGQEDKE